VNIPDARTQPGIWLIWPGASANARRLDGMHSIPALHTSLVLTESLHQRTEAHARAYWSEKPCTSVCHQMATVHLKYTHQAGYYGLRAVTVCFAIPRGSTLGRRESALSLA
jgi:hypothetical protein